MKETSSETVTGARRSIASVENLEIDIRANGAPPKRVVDNVSFSVGAGEIVALVGESGSGKTLLGRSLLGLLPDVAMVSGGKVMVGDVDVTKADRKTLRSLRGGKVGMVFQEPMSSLNPALKIGFQMSEALMLHQNIGRAQARKRCLEMLERLQIVEPEKSFDAYPHQFSGGMRQRIMLASVLAIRPDLLIADEPTTALDALICKEVMDLMLEVTKELGTAVLLVSHDLGMVAEYADEVVVMKQGRQVESGRCSDVLLHPKHAYTQALMGSLPIPAVSEKQQKTSGPLLAVHDLCVDFRRGGFSFLGNGRTFRAVEDASFVVNKGEILAVVGESGSGKTTIGRTIMQLCAKASGQISFDGQNFDEVSTQEMAAIRSKMQMVFQDPFSSLDPRMTLEAIVAEALRHHKGMSKKEKIERARSMLLEVGLDSQFATRFPHELSGGQRQRVCIARAIVAQPRFIVADEPVSALDVTIQHQVLELLGQLQKKYGFSYLFISHDLGVVEQIADRVIVMYRGRILEVGNGNAIFDRPQHPYTHRLLDATPRLVKTGEGSYGLVAHKRQAVSAPEGYSFYNHGSIPSERISRGTPELINVGAGHQVCCVPQ